MGGWAVTTGVNVVRPTGPTAGGTGPPANTRRGMCRRGRGLGSGGTHPPGNGGPGGRSEGRPKTSTRGRRQGTPCLVVGRVTP